MKFYDAQLTNTTSPSVEWRNSLQALVDYNFENASDYYTIKKQDRSTGVWSDISVRLAKEFNIKHMTTVRDDYRKIIFKNNSVTSIMGDMFEFNNYRWMVIDTGRLETATNAVMIQRCNVQLKFIPAATPVLPVLPSTPLVIDAIAMNRIIDPSEDRIILLPQNQLRVLVPNTSDTKKIKWAPNGGTRFIFGDPAQLWMVTAYDGISNVRRTVEATPNDLNGYVELRMTLNGINNQIDNVPERVAKQSIA